MEIPIPIYFWHNDKAHIGAFKKGFVAASEGKPCVSPYADKRGGYHNNITFSRSFIVAWEDGWRKYHATQHTGAADGSKRGLYEHHISATCNCVACVGERNAAANP